MDYSTRKSIEQAILEADDMPCPSCTELLSASDVLYGITPDSDPIEFECPYCGDYLTLTTRIVLVCEIAPARRTDRAE
jgi:predicted RNA-binding Zn-ribbon protein involved in translation (DUF1610 family)